MIWLYSGTPGSGKSLDVAKMIRGRLKRKRPVICNFPVSVNLISKKHPESVPFSYVNNQALTPDYLIQYSRDYFGDSIVKEEALLLVIDECQLIFNAREWNKAGRSEWLSFFTQHRKLGYKIVLIAQFDRMIDRQVRSLIEYEVIHRKVSNFGLFGQILGLLTGGLFVAVQVWYPLKEKVDTSFFVARKKYYKLYDTYAQF